MVQDIFSEFLKYLNRVVFFYPKWPEEFRSTSSFYLRIVLLEMFKIENYFWVREHVHVCHWREEVGLLLYERLGLKRSLDTNPLQVCIKFVSGRNKSPKGMLNEVLPACCPVIWLSMNGDVSPVTWECENQGQAEVGLPKLKLLIKCL